MNIGIATGRLSNDVKVFDNKDGSKKATFKLALQRKYVDKDGQTPVDHIEFSTFFAKDAKDGVLEYLKKGNLVSVKYDVRQNVYEKDGEKIYSQFLNVERTDIELLATKMKDESEDLADALADTPKDAPKKTGKKK